MGATGAGPDGNQPSNIVERRAWENVPRQSPELPGEFPGELVGDD